MLNSLQKFGLKALALILFFSGIFFLVKRSEKQQAEIKALEIENDSLKESNDAAAEAKEIRESVAALSADDLAARMLERAKNRGKLL